MRFCSGFVINFFADAGPREALLQLGTVLIHRQMQSPLGTCLVNCPAALFASSGTMCDIVCNFAIISIHGCFDTPKLDWNEAYMSIDCDTMVEQCLAARLTSIVCSTSVTHEFMCMPPWRRFPSMKEAASRQSAHLRGTEGEDDKAYSQLAPESGPHQDKSRPPPGPHDVSG